MEPQVRREQALAWRLSAHGVAERLPARRRAEAVRPGGLRTGGPDPALVGWHPAHERRLTGEPAAVAALRGAELGPVSGG